MAVAELADQNHTLPLSGQRLSVPETGSGLYTARLLQSLGADTNFPALDVAAAQRAWARSGAMALTGKRDGPPLACPTPLAACMQGAFSALQTLSGNAIRADYDPAILLGERAAFSGLQRNGSVNPGDSCRLLQAADGWIALNLPREDDWELLPALLEGAAINDWDTLEAVLKQHKVSALCERAALLGLALVDAGGEPCDRIWFEICARGAVGNVASQPLVIDLSSLWAGPLCSQLLQSVGARVIKVESLHRPDGARRGSAEFYSLLNAGKGSVALDLRSKTGVAQLRALIEQADIVIEASRPRALRQMGIFAEELVAQRSGLTWISITGYGRDEARAMRIAYGDDAAVAAGLSAAMHRQYEEWLFCADAVADPLTGVHAALAAIAGWRNGGGYLFDISLHAVVSHCIKQAQLPCGEVVVDGDNWALLIDGKTEPVRAPQARPVISQAAALGTDTRRVLAELGITC